MPGLKDPGLAPQGQTGLIISLLAEYDLFRLAQEAGWLDEFVFDARGAGAAGHRRIRLSDARGQDRPPLLVLAPEHRKAGGRHSEGAITGWAFQKAMPVVNRIQHSGRSVRTPLPSVYQAGQWAYSPAGVPMSILTGKLAADKALRKS
ncbi:MAG: hypothetical protein MZW92_04275 [Comamonadaceae bacterium]|nr:hypothetical protein [Comamonadaceae bacterium]